MKKNDKRQNQRNDLTLEIKERIKNTSIKS
jgi:hypothetical protein